MQRVRSSELSWGTWVELCAPDVRNALDPAAVAALSAVFERTAPGAVLLTAQGPAFCAGGDLSVLASAAASRDLVSLLVDRAAAFADLIEAIVASPRPVIAAIDGPAVGGGACLALACQVRIATPRARLVLGWSRWGLPPDGGAGALLAAAVGEDAAAELLADAAEIGADSPFAPAVFTRVAPVGELATVAREVAASLAAGDAERPGQNGQLLAALRAGRDAELAALAAAGAVPSVVEGLAMLYKIDR